MYKLFVFAAVLAVAFAAPGVIVSHAAVPVVHATPVLHAPVIHPVVAAKTTITKSSQVVNHGTPVVHAPVVHAAHVYPVVHSVPIVKTVPLVAVHH